MKTLFDLLEDYLGYKASLKQSEATLRTKRFNLVTFLRWLQRSYAVRMAEQLRKKHLEAWLVHLSARRTVKGLPLKPRSINKQIESARTFLRYLSSRGFIQSGLVDVLEYVKEPSLLPSSVLTHAQVRKLISKIDTGSTEGVRDKALFEVLYSTGVRVGELLGLDVADIDFHQATALVTGKGEKQRVVPIGKTAASTLESYVRAVRPFLLVRRSLGEGGQRGSSERAVFLDKYGKRLPYYVFLRRVHQYADLAGLDVVVTPHTFRRSCTTELLRGGANMYHVKELLGHESLDTLKHYARLTITDLKRTHQRCHPREKDA